MCSDRSPHPLAPGGGSVMLGREGATWTAMPCNERYYG